MLQWPISVTASAQQSRSAHVVAAVVAVGIRCAGGAEAEAWLGDCSWSHETLSDSTCGQNTVTVCTGTDGDGGGVGVCVVCGVGVWVG